MTTALQVITNVEAQTQFGVTTGWIVEAGTLASEAQWEAVSHVDIPATEDEAEWYQGLRAALAAAGYAIPGEIVHDDPLVIADIISVA